MKRIGVFGKNGIWICNFCRKTKEMYVIEEKKQNLYSQFLPENEEDVFLKHYNFDLHNFCKKIKKVGVFEKKKHFLFKISTGK